MNLRHMRHFVAVAEELHFGRAAKRLNMAQPPLSQSIRRLEIDLGVDLFDRSRRGVELSAAGRVFLVEARRTLAQAELARKMTRREAEQIPEVRVAFTGSALYRFLPDLIVRYRAAAPDVHIRLFERPSVNQADGLLAGDFDIGFMTGAVHRPGGSEVLVVERSPIVAAIPGDWPLAARDSVTLAELSDQPFIRPPKFDDGRLIAPAAGSDVGDGYPLPGPTPRVTQEATQTNTTLSLVGAGLGCSLIMASAALTGTRNVRFLPIRRSDYRATWELVMMWLPDHLNRLGGDFVRFVHAYLVDHPELLDLAAVAIPAPPSPRQAGPPVA